MNQMTTEDFKELILENKTLIFGVKIKIGQSIWKFAGAGNEKLMFRSKKSGIDITQASEGKFWVKYENINPMLKGALISEIAKAKNQLREATNKINGIKEEKNVSIKKSWEEIQEKTSNPVSSKAKELGFIPANELELY